MKSYLQKFTMLELSVVVTILLSAAIMFLLLSSRVHASGKNPSDVKAEVSSQMKEVSAEEYKHRELRLERAKMMVDRVRIYPNGRMEEVSRNFKSPVIDPNVPSHLRPSIQEPIIPVSSEIYNERIVRYERAKARFDRVIAGSDGKYYEPINAEADELRIAPLGNVNSSASGAALLRREVTLEEYSKRKAEYENTQSKLNYIRILSDGSIGRIDPNQQFPEINPNVPPHLRPQIQEPVLPVTEDEYKKMREAADKAKDRYSRVMLYDDGKYYEDIDPTLEADEISKKGIEKPKDATTPSKSKKLKDKKSSKKKK